MTVTTSRMITNINHGTTMKHGWPLPWTLLAVLLLLLCHSGSSFAVDGGAGGIVNSNVKSTKNAMQVPAKNIRFQPSKGSPRPLHNQIQSAAGSSDIVVDPPSSARSVKILQYLSFLFLLSFSLVAFAPAPALITMMGAESATATLSALTASAAAVEIVFSPAFGSALDSMGRKGALLSTVLGMVLMHTAVAGRTSVPWICAAKFVGLVCLGLFSLTTQTMMSDLFVTKDTSKSDSSDTTSNKLSAALGIQMAATGMGFLVGAISAGILSEKWGGSLAVTYGVSAAVGTLAILLASAMPETLAVDSRRPFTVHGARKLMLQPPWSGCTRLLFRHGRKVRMLAIILLLQSVPLYMGDFMQIFAKTQWNLSTKNFSSLVAITGVMGIVANGMGSVLVKQMGIKKFTGLAIVSRMLSAIGCVVDGVRGNVVGTIVGFLGGAQSIGITAALVSEGAQSGLPQGELAGERSSLLAMLKVAGPLMYSFLFIQGQKHLGINVLPFILNISLFAGALVLSQIHLASKQDDTISAK